MEQARSENDVIFVITAHAINLNSVGSDEYVHQSLPLSLPLPHPPIHPPTYSSTLRQPSATELL
ncbi:hypothetical protein T02_10255 [Trichinella nativa]|uniref:Uncharacterized protein n=1 Tax=Trichinella nativa TaxID=6335 RepID=A0A0V1L8N6_9BILA|nr:hypothetical protein T02_10255 [Trichinella nativa]